MFVRVDVRNHNSSRLNLLNLCPGLTFNLCSIQTPGKGTRSERLEPVAEFSRTSNCGEPGGVKYWVAVDQYDVAADTQGGGGFRHLCGLAEGGTVCHERGRGNDTESVRLDDGAVHACSESEVIRVDDEPPQTASLAGGVKGPCAGERSS